MLNTSFSNLEQKRVKLFLSFLGLEVNQTQFEFPPKKSITITNKKLLSPKEPPPK